MIGPFLAFVLGMVILALAFYILACSSPKT